MTFRQAPTRRLCGPKWACEMGLRTGESHNPSKSELWIRHAEVFNAQKCCRSAVEDPDMGLCQRGKTSDSSSADLRDDMSQTFQTSACRIKRRICSTSACSVGFLNLQIAGKANFFHFHAAQLQGSCRNRIPLKPGRLVKTHRPGVLCQNPQATAAISLFTQGGLSRPPQLTSHSCRPNSRRSI